MKSSERLSTAKKKPKNKKSTLWQKFYIFKKTLCNEKPWTEQLGHPFSSPFLQNPSLLFIIQFNSQPGSLSPFHMPPAPPSSFSSWLTSLLSLSMNSLLQSPQIPPFWDGGVHIHILPRHLSPVQIPPAPIPLFYFPKTPLPPKDSHF